MVKPTNLSRNLRRITKAKGLTQIDIADKLHLKPTTVNTWFRGANAPRFNTLEKLAKALDVSIDELTADPDDPRYKIIKTNIAPLPDNFKAVTNDGFLGKSKEFWQIMELVDNMEKSQLRDVLAMIRIIKR